MLTLKPVPAEAEELVRVPMTVAVAVNARGGWALVGWRGGSPVEMREQVQLVLDDPVGVVRTVTLMVPVLAREEVAKLLLGDGP